ncbi:MAG TPA: UDP-N-acetylglucosamine--N-acetylmuramyl-(pentapeptide) pyrophosphoryl-undecaprenol N-acetylglucosamine transferase [Pseudonocardiaceae bacterium]|nr:UDP-N-acetylglucosamine--N-acetylmuramyl-(pentapeptide) pyrophosphoryl-undecaprenol N-acetylglucosamine transferase [Pseudonocardiaceae bacterium]
MDLPEILSRLAGRGRPVRVLATGGGTGGHTYPALTTIRTARGLLAEVGLDLDVLYVGSATGLEARIATQEGLAFAAIPTGKLRRAANPLRMISAANLRDIGRLAQGVIAARRIVRGFDPDAVLSTGGYVAVPVGLTTQAPLLVHEQTTRLGLANRILARRAERIALSSAASLPLLPPALRGRAVVTGNPVRPELLTGDPAAAVKALDWTGHDPGRPTIYITGGAQGSVQINRLVNAVLPRLLTRANVIHQCGQASLAATQQLAARLASSLTERYRVVDFVGSELPDVLALADIVISRSGAGTLAELTALGKPAVLIPLIPTGGDEQEHNARYLAERHAAQALIGAQATPAALWHHLDELISDAAQRSRMAAAARRLGHPQAATDLAIQLVALCATAHPGD